MRERPKSAEGRRASERDFLTPPLRFLISLILAMLIPGTCWPSLLPKEPSKFNRRSFRASLLLALAPRKEQRPQSYASPMQMPTLVQLQPEAVVSMSLRVDPLNVEGKLRDEKGQRDWNSGLFGCCTSPHDLALSVFW